MESRHARVKRKRVSSSSSSTKRVQRMFVFLGECKTCDRIIRSDQQRRMPGSMPGSRSSKPTFDHCKANLKITKELGRGDVGIAYEIEPGAQNQNINMALDPKGRYVLKEVQIRSSSEMMQFSEEVCIGRHLGELGIAPRIYDCWTCMGQLSPPSTSPSLPRAPSAVPSPPYNPASSYNPATSHIPAPSPSPSPSSPAFPVKAYYIMDRIDHVWGSVYPSDRPIDSKNRPAPAHLERKLVGVLEKMIEAGIIHQDCHPGNIGIIGKGPSARVVLFDFGFSIRSLDKISHPAIVLMSQIYMVIEKYNKTIMYDSYLYDVIYNIRQRKHRWI